MAQFGIVAAMPRRPTSDSTSVDIDNYRMRNLRKVQGVSIADFAAKIGVSYAYVSQIECGRKTPSPETFGRICDALNIDTSQRHTLLSPTARRRLAASGIAA